MRHGSLFSGIGGFDLASEWMGWENVFHCECNEFGQKVLKYYWPKAITYNDITKTDFSIHRGTIDILTGGFPCQPYSSSGKRLGKEDSRHLWPQMLRTIREIQPTWVVGENVRGLTNWNGGLVFDEVQADLEAEGYEVTPFLLPACAVNAPHRRDRIWFVAYSTSISNGTDKLQKIRSKNGEVSREGTQTIHDATRPNGIKGVTSDTNRNGFNQRNCNNEVNTSERGEYALGNFNECNGNGDVANTNSRGLEGSEKVGWHSEYVKRESQFRNASDSLRNGYESWKEGKCSKKETQSNDKQFKRRNKLPRANFEMFPSVPPICDGDDGLSDRLDSITFSKWRNESIKAGGNAIVPQVVHQIFKAIQQYSDLQK